MGFTIEQIITAAPGFTNGNLNSTATLRGVYQNLTGDPFPFFKSLLDLAFPPDLVSSVPGVNPDDPFPIARMSFLVDKSTFGVDEAQDVINTSAGTWPEAFWLVVEGFSKTSFNSLGAIISLSGPFANLAGITITQGADIDFENAANPQAPQRIRVPFDIAFSGASLPNFPSGSATYELDAVLTVGGANVPGSNASTLFELEGAPIRISPISIPRRTMSITAARTCACLLPIPPVTTIPYPEAPLFRMRRIQLRATALATFKVCWAGSTGAILTPPDPMRSTRKLRVPLPGRGYWAKKSCRKEASQATRSTHAAKLAIVPFSAPLLQTKVGSDCSD